MSQSCYISLPLIKIWFQKYRNIFNIYYKNNKSRTIALLLLFLYDISSIIYINYSELLVELDFPPAGKFYFILL